MGNIRRLLDVYQFPGFRPKAKIKGVLGDPKGRVIQLERRQKNGVRALRHWAPKLLRQQDAAYPGSFLRGCAGISGSGSTPRLLPEVRESEAGAAEMAVRQSLLR